VSYVDTDDTWAIGRTNCGLATTVPGEVLAHIDFLAAEHGHTRASVVRAMIRFALDNPDEFAEKWLHTGPTRSADDERLELEGLAARWNHP
jgi:hypothetical protein